MVMVSTKVTTVTFVRWCAVSEQRLAFSISSTFPFCLHQYSRHPLFSIVGSVSLVHPLKYTTPAAASTAPTIMPSQHLD